MNESTEANVSKSKSSPSGEKASSALLEAAARIETSNFEKLSTSNAPKPLLNGGAPQPELAPTFQKTLLETKSAPAPSRTSPPTSVTVNGAALEQETKAPPVSAERGQRSEDAKEKRYSGIGVVILDVNGAVSPEPAIRSLGEEKKLVYVTAEPKSDAAAAAHRMGAELVKLSGKAINPGRARNTGYRRLKTLDPNMEYVQFLEPDFILHADWFENACAFMTRRPEVAVIDGHKRERFSEKSMLNMVKEISRRRPKGEVQTTGESTFVRAEAFEAAGGFRGDIASNDTDDLCLRLRRRGQHVWRVETQMGVNHSRKRDLRDWWREAKRNGYEYAHGVFLHGAAPERFRVLEQARAIIWGGAFPMFVVLAAFISAISVRFFSPLTSPYGVFFWILCFGFLVYFAKIFLIALRHGPGQKSSWAYGALVTVGHFGEFLGVAKYHLDSRSEKPNGAKA